MWTYTPPLRDMRFVIDEVLRAPAAWRQWPALHDIDSDTAAAVLEEAGRFAAGVLAPINASGDLQGCTWQDGAVRTPTGYREAYRAFVDGGWPALEADPQDGGQGLSAVLGAALNEMLAAANHGWTMYPGLLHGAYECLRRHASDAVRARYLPKLASGEWLATMNLTEPQAGSDLGLLRTRAEPGPEGSWRLTGSKIFISGGEHDLTDNIVHLVLARLPDAPPGTKGISLFVAPKFLPDGQRNAIHCTGIEKKMGIKGSATCAMSFEGAQAWLVGEPHRGLAAMFVMMNSARLHVAMQGVGHLDTAQANAHAYAQERIQGRGQAIAAHPAMRRTLWSLRAVAEAQRVVAYRAALWLDQSHHAPDADERSQAEARLGLLTPIIKAFFTENGHRGADEALQVWGGYGFVHDHGIEQTVRDSRIAMIYEGTNEIQAIDLVQRKILDDGGQRLDALLDELLADANAHSACVALQANALTHQVALARTAVAALVKGSREDAQWPLRVADDVLRAMGLLLLGWAWLRIAAAAQPLAAEPWYADKIRLADFGVQWLLTEADWRWRRVMAREHQLPALP